MNRARAFFLMSFALGAGCEPARVQPPPRDPPHVEFAEPSLVVRASVGRNDICLLMVNGTVQCKQDWRPAGERRYGSFFPVPGLADVAEVSAGHHHACAVTRTGGVACWGRNMNGEVGGDDILVRSASSISLPAAATAVRVGEKQSCARLASGSVWCWGEVGGMSRAAPHEISTLSRATDIAVSSGGVCAVSKDGGLRCAYGPKVTNEPLGKLAVSKVVVSDNRGCAIATDATVHCFVLSATATPSHDMVPILWDPPVAVVSDAVELAAGSSHVCARKRDRSVWCWGANDYGQLGNGTRDESGVAVQVAHITDSIEIYAGGDRACALRDKGLYCWGADLTGDGMYRALTGLADEPGPPGPNDSLVPEWLRVPIAVRPAVVGLGDH